MTDLYILKDGVPVLANTIDEWGTWFETAERQVALDEIDGVEVSTVFLGADYSHTGGAPVLYETMIFGGEYDKKYQYYHTLEEAREGHRKAVAMITESPK